MVDAEFVLALDALDFVGVDRLGLLFEADPK